MPNEQGFLTPEDLRNRPSVPADDGTTRAAMAAFSGLHQASRLTPFPGAPLELPLALKLAFSGLDQASRLTPFLGGPLELSPEWKRTLDAWQEHARRNRDRAQKHVTQDHVAAALPHIDWQVFLRKQRGDEEDAQLVQVLADLGAALAATTPAAAKLQAGLARELLFFAWADVAADVSFDGDDSEPVDWVNKATGEKFTQPATMGDVTMFFEHAIREENADYWRDFSSRYVERDILEGFWADYQKAILPTPSSYTPAFRNGIGNYPTHAVAYGASRAQFQFEKWSKSDDGSPEFHHFWGKAGVARYRIDADTVPSVAAAWDIVKGLSDRHADVLEYIEAKWLANRDLASNGLHITAGELLDAMDYEKQSAGGHRSENVEMIAAIIRDLERQTVETRFEYYPPGKRKSETIVIESKLVVSSTSVSRATSDGGKRQFAWYIRPGDWAIQLHQLQPQYGVALLAVLQLNPQSDYIAKRIGRYLLHNWRERFARDDLNRTYRIADLLDKAGVSMDRANPKRFRTRVEAAFNLLRDKDVFQCWAYGSNVPKAEGRWFDDWLIGGVIFTPHPAVIERKQTFLTRRRGSAKALPKAN